jgi:hypothetical protein
MHAAIFFLGAIAATAFASPVDSNRVIWRPAAGTKPACDSASDKYIPASKISSLAEQACTAMMPGCAYPANLPKGTMCVAVMDWPLAEPKSVTMNETVMSQDGVSVASGWKAECECLRNQMSIFWSRR